MTKVRPLTAKQKRFVEEYLVDRNGTQAAIRAGYRPKAAAQTANENLRKPHIAAAMDIASHGIAQSMREIVERETGNLIGVLIEIANDKEQPASARVMAAREALDRGHGKATQPVQGEHEHYHYDVSDEPLGAEEWAERHATH